MTKSGSDDPIEQVPATEQFSQVQREDPRLDQIPLPMDDENGADSVCAVPEEMSDAVVASPDLNNQVEIRRSTRDRRPRQTFMYQTLGQPTLQPHTAFNTGFYGPPARQIGGYTSYYPTPTPTYFKKEKEKTILIC